MLYLVVVPGGSAGGVRFEDVHLDEDVRVGDRLIIGDLVVCVRYVGRPPEPPYERTAICTPAED